MSKLNKYMHNTIALVYDFDGTLTPQPMQEYTILPEIGIKNGQKFWEEVAKESIKSKGEGIVTYMRLMLKKSQEKEFAVTRRKLNSLADRIEYYPGVVQYFERINKYFSNHHKGVNLRHYIISAGLAEIIEATKIASHFYKIFASEYYYNEYGQAIFPNVLVNDTLKTQFIFRINKGIEDLNDSINNYMPDDLRPIPFQNILYIGDGLTDVPCMTVVRKNGGYSIAVYKPRNSHGKSTCINLLKNQRVDFIALADYRNNSELDKLIKLTLSLMVEEIKYGRESFNQAKKYRYKE